MIKPPTVLIIEDDPVFRRVLSFTVAKSGLAVETANDGREGFDRLVRGGIDFVVTDYQMPGYGGVELLRRLGELENFRRPAVILCTAKGLELDSEQLRKEFDLAEVMHKPFSPRKLSEKIIRHLEEQGLLPVDQSQHEQTSVPAAPITTPGLTQVGHLLPGSGNG